MVTASIPRHAVMLRMQCMFQSSCSHDNFQKENQTKNRRRGPKSYKVASVFWCLFDHFGVGGAPRDTLKQSIADQSGFWYNFDGFWCPFWEATGHSRSSVFSPGAPRGRQRGEKNAQNTISEAPWTHVRVLFRTRPVPKGGFATET